MSILSKNGDKFQQWKNVCPARRELVRKILCGLKTIAHSNKIREKNVQQITYKRSLGTDTTAVGPVLICFCFSDL